MYAYPLNLNEENTHTCKICSLKKKKAYKYTHNGTPNSSYVEQMTILKSCKKSFTINIAN
jgi:hypothetical protein